MLSRLTVVGPDLYAHVPRAFPREKSLLDVIRANRERHSPGEDGNRHLNSLERQIMLRLFPIHGVTLFQILVLSRNR